MLDNKELSQIRREYQSKGFLEHDALPDAFAQFSQWLHEAVVAEVPDPTAMVLSTSSHNIPTSRVVLLKTLDARGFVFFTNYDSRKGKELAENPNASLLFFWHELHRQVRIEGRVEKTSADESDQYFQSRPFESKVAAWASNQGSAIPNRNQLDARFEELKIQYTDGNVPTPPHWGGYVLVPTEIEFWAGRPNRLHDRILYEKSERGWTLARLAP